MTTKSQKILNGSSLVGAQSLFKHNELLSE
jgi:hypothetical protein